MDYSQVCQGWIYCITNKVNGKRYIGQTINYTRRKYEHFELEETCSILGKAFCKYGKENFEMKVVLTFKAINEEVRKQLLDYFERYYIIKFGTFQKEYNATLGGEGSLGFKHTEETKKKISELRKLDSKIGEITSRPVLLYDLKGVFAKEYKSVREAVKAVGGNIDSYSNAMYALRDPKKKLYNYLWRYKTTNYFPIFIEPYLWPTSKKVYHYSKNGELLGEYSCTHEASESLNIPVKKIWKSAGTKNRKRINADYWSYEAPITS